MNTTYHHRQRFLLSIIWACATFTSSDLRSAPGPGPLRYVEPGPIAITSSPSPAEFSFDQPSGKEGTATESAQNAVASVLATPSLGNPQIEAAVGILEFAAAPFVATYSAITGGHRKLTPDKLSETEQELVQAMRKMADQDHLRQMLISVANQTTQRAILECPPNGTSSLQETQWSALLQTGVKQLRLRRLRNTDKSFRLEIEAEARLVRATDGSVLYQRPLHFESDEALFVDWAREGGLESVAATAYRTLAQQIARDIFSAPVAATIHLGAVEKTKPVFANLSSLQATTERMSLGAQTHSANPQLQFVSYHEPGTGAIEILPDLSSKDLHIQGLISEASTGAGLESDTEYALDGLENNRNFVVQAAACIGAIPMGLWEHTVVAFRSRNDETLRSANATIQASSRRQPPQRLVAAEVASRLANETSETVLSSVAVEPEADKIERPAAQFDMRHALGQKGGPAPDTRLQIRVTNSALSGKPGKNPRLQLSVEMEATLVRTSDGQELCVWHIKYLSSPKRVSEWVAEDALALRREFVQCCHEISAAVVDAVTSGGFVSPKRSASPTVAAN
jgi:hypothetical protein